MDFALDEAQQVISRMADEVLESAAPEGAWKALGEAGLLSLVVPESLGGEGLGVLELAVLLREVGRHAVVIPALSHLMTGVLPAARWGNPSLLSGDMLLTASLERASYRNGRVTGVCRGVPYADTAHCILVPTAEGIALVDPAHAGLDRTPTSSGAPEFTVRFTDTPAEELWQVDPVELERLAIVGAAAMADGVLKGALDLTAKHVATREQFGRPLSAFQAVAQQIADVYIASRTLHLAALSAAWRLHHGLSCEADIAATWLVQEGVAALRTCHHLHGGIGLDVTYPLHRYTSLMKDLVRYVHRAL